MRSRADHGTGICRISFYWPVRGRSALMLRLRSERLQVFSLPAHRIVDAVPSAGVVEENPLFDSPGIHLAILAEMNGALRESVGLTAGVQAVHIGFVFVGANVGVKKRRIHKSKNRPHEEHQREHRRIADSAYLPSFTPAGKGGFGAPAKQSKKNKQANQQVT